MRAILPPTEQQRLAVRGQPEHSPVMHMRWEQLLFLHWSFAPDRIQRTLPPGLHVDTFDGRAWVGVVPFLMRDVRPVGLPAMPWVSDFLELNVRTYVFDEAGVPGVWFYSLDCNQPVAVEAAKRFFHLNYVHADMKAYEDEATGFVLFESQRRGTDRPSRFKYRALGEPRQARPGSLEFFLVERYILFAFDEARERLGAGRVSHMPYDILDADVPEWDAVMIDLNGLSTEGTPPEHACATRAQAVAATRVVFG